MYVSRELIMFDFVYDLYVFVLLSVALILIFFTPRNATHRVILYYGLFILGLNLITLRVLM
jgi:Na+/phosphate symporter